MNKQDFLDYFRDIPISINNLYGDPFHPKQVANTFQKLDSLIESNHIGIVSIITKTEISTDIVEKLSWYRQRLNLILLVSISNLPLEIEPVKGDRYNTLKLCNTYNIPCLAYVRPFIPPYNVSENSIEYMFKQIKASGTDNIVISGLRGNDDILANFPNIKEISNYNLRVKIIPSEIRKIINSMKQKYSLTVFDRTSCGVSYVLGKTRSYNPYYTSPQLAGCINCPLKSTCFDIQSSIAPTAKDLELTRILGYNAEINMPATTERCNVKPEERTQCISCCTSCFLVDRPSIEVFDQNVCLGDLALLRLLTKKSVFAKNVVDNGDADIARPKMLGDHNLYLLNSWWSYSNNIDQCYRCSYCIVPHFKNQNTEYGEVPLKVAENIWEGLKI